MSSNRVKAHGRSAHATLQYLNSRRVKALSLTGAPQHYEVPDPKSRDDIEEACRLMLSVPLGEQLAVGGTAAEHVTADRTEVRRSLELAKRLNPADPVSALEPIYENLHGTLASPKIWAGISSLADALLRHQTMSGDRVSAVLKGAMRQGEHKGRIFPLMRRITIVR